MPSSRQFFCATQCGGDNTAIFTIEVPVELIKRSSVLQNAACTEERSKLVLPADADCRFIDAWTALVQSESADERYQQILPVDAVLKAVQVRTGASVQLVS